VWRWTPVIAIALAIGACGVRAPERSSAPSVSSGGHPSLSPSPAPSVDLEPGEMPTTFAVDADPAELVPDDLIPVGADVTGEWFAFTDDGVMVLVAWAEPGADVSRLPRGFAVWRRSASPPHWRVSVVERRTAEDGVQEIQVSTADVTGDGSDDAVVFEGVGGSGACGRWAVIDLVQGEETYRRELCDARIDPGPPRSPGLVLTESVYRPGDAHCCPSAMRATTLTWTGRRWRVTDEALIER
jgi:hypothetical protein